MDHVIVVQSRGVAIAHTLHQQLQNLLHGAKTPFVQLAVKPTAGANIESAWMPNGWRVLYQPVNRPQRIDGGILPAGFDEKKNHPLQFLEQMVPFSCFYSFFTEWSLKFH